MFGPWISTFGWLRDRLPKGKGLSWLKPQLNFITIHYTYIAGMALLGSIVLYPYGNMRYIDALFFASGSATQSGLNPIDLNQIKLYQQVTVMMIACLCNPIIINTFVVFVRLYWFEKRFQNVVLEARSLRRQRTLSRRKSEAKADPNERDVSGEESAVGNREIVVLRHPDGAAQRKRIADESTFHAGEDRENQSKEPTEEDESSGDVSPTEQRKSPFTRDITFKDELRPTRSPDFRLPEKRSKEHNIQFVENQRNPKDKGTLRIPGPRDFDMGHTPERIEDGEEMLENQTTNEDRPISLKKYRSSSLPPHELNEDDHPFKSHITIDAPTHPRRPHIGPHQAPSAYTRMRRPSNSETEGENPNMNLRNRSRTRSFASFLTKSQTQERDPMPYLSWTPTVGRNSAFVDLTEEQREELGGIEYRSLKLLAIILVFYYVGFHLLGMVCLLPWVMNTTKYRTIVSDAGVNPRWWGIFTPASMFNDLGFTLTPDSMVSFQRTALPLILGSFLIIIGNTGFPCLLRFIIWVSSKCVPVGSGVWEELKFLLDHPRRCFTLLFPSSANWWLFWVLILLNGIDVFFFIILDLHNPVVTSIPGGYRFLSGLFQASATRTAGFSVVNIAGLHPGTQVSYLIMMYISIFPIAISTRQTNVYEEKSLGVWGSPDDEETSGKNSYLGTHLRRQLSFDLWFVFLGFFLIAVVEGSRLQNTNEYSFTLFSVLFEIISAYGTVGLSLGYPGINASFSAEFRTLSKLIIIAMQIRGRHRGLPYALDRAILLPSETLHKKEDEDAALRARRNSNIDDLNAYGIGIGDRAPGAQGPGTFSPGTFARTESMGATLTGGNTLSRVGTSGSAAGRGGVKRTRTVADLGRFLSGALSAGPQKPMREKRA